MPRCFEPHTIEYMKKNATLTVRIPQQTRERLEELAQREGRSLSQQVERMIERGFESLGSGGASARRLSGLLARERSPDYGDFRSVRNLLSASLLDSPPRRGPAGR